MRTITQIVQNALCVFLWHKQTSLQSSLSSVSVIDLWQCISRQLFRRSCFMAPIMWFLRFTSETEYVDNFCTASAIFSAPKRGVLCPPKFCSWGLWKSPPPCFAAYGFVYVIGLHAVQFGNNWMKKIPEQPKLDKAVGRDQFGCQRNFLNSIISKLNKHVVLLLINILYCWLVNPDFLACHRREILYTRTRLFVVDTKLHCKI